MSDISFWLLERPEELLPRTKTTLFAIQEITKRMEFIEGMFNNGLPIFEEVKGLIVDVVMYDSGYPKSPFLEKK